MRMGRIGRMGLMAGVAWVAGVACGEDGVYSANRLPGTALIWSAEKSSQEVARVAGYAGAAYSPTNPPPAAGVTSVNGATGAVSVTAAGIGALTNETDAAALAAIASLTNQARVWIDAPGATNWATVEGGLVKAWVSGIGVDTNHVVWTFSADFGESTAGLKPMYAAYTHSYGTTLTEGLWTFNAPSLVNERATIGYAHPEEPSSWASESSALPATVTKTTLLASGEAYVAYLPEAYTNLISTTPAPIAPVPPYVTTFTGLTNWVACQNIFEAALISGMTVNREAFDAATNTLAQAAEEAYTRSSTAITYLNAHTDNGTIAADKHLLTGDRALIDSVPGKATPEQVSALIYSNSVSRLAIYTNASGAATSYWSVAGGTTNTGSFAQSGTTSGAITNGQQYVKLGGDNVTISTNSLLVGMSSMPTIDGFAGSQKNQVGIMSKAGELSGLVIGAETARYVQFVDNNFVAKADFGSYGGDMYFVNRAGGNIIFERAPSVPSLTLVAGGGLKIGLLSDFPVAQEGLLFAHSVSNKLYLYIGGAWRPVGN